MSQITIHDHFMISLRMFHGIIVAKVLSIM